MTLAPSFFTETKICYLINPNHRKKNKNRRRKSRFSREIKMVLWEITLGTAYFLGLKRTYKLALKLQRRLISPKYPKARQFAYKRIRGVFDVALRIHRNIQERDIEVGRNLGNWILRWLDRMKPSANIRRSPPPKPPANGSNTLKNVKNSCSSVTQEGPTHLKITDQQSAGRILTPPLNSRMNSFPTLGMMMRNARPTSMNIQYRHIGSGTPLPNVNFRRDQQQLEGVFRRDIMLWMMQK